MTETRVCKMCGWNKPIDEYHWRNKSSGARLRICKPCYKEKYRNRTCQLCGTRLRSHAIHCWECQGKLNRLLKADRPWSDACSTALWSMYVRPRRRRMTIAEIAVEMNRTEGMIRDKIAELRLDRQAAI